MIKDITRFAREVHGELSKVTWPKFDEFAGATIVVLVLVSFFSIYLGFVDKCFTEAWLFVVKLYGGY